MKMKVLVCFVIAVLLTQSITDLANAWNEYSLA